MSPGVTPGEHGSSDHGAYGMPHNRRNGATVAPQGFSGYQERCPQCQGQGIVRGSGVTNVGGLRVPFHDCLRCKGAGWVPVASEKRSA